MTRDPQKDLADAKAAFQAGLSTVARVSKVSMTYATSDQRHARITMIVVEGGHEAVTLPFYFKLSGGWTNELKHEGERLAAKLKAVNGHANGHAVNGKGS